MPIKFRCKQCRQFLGISRSMAGQVVDCPTCGHTIRVPTLEGRVDPVPSPKLNLQDSALANALGELAAIGEQPAQDQTAAAEPDHTPQPVEIVQPTPLPEPVPIDPPSHAALAPSLIPSPPEATHAPGQLEAPEQALAALIDTDTPPPPSAKATFRSRRHSALFAPQTLLVSASAAVVFFCLGFLLGRAGQSDSEINGTETTKPNEVVVANGNDTPPEQPLTTGKPAIQGRITFKNDSGESRPDDGARVLVFPSERAGETKLSIVGFRAGDSEADVRVARAALQALGGGIGVADQNGNYQLSLPSAGVYRILVLSHYQPRDEQTPVEPEVLDLLEKYFDRPQQLLGRVGYDLGEVRYNGESAAIWDYSFERTL